MAELPAHAPYTIVLGEPIEIRVFREVDESSDSYGLIFGEVEYREDKFGAVVEPDNLGPSMTLELAIDELVLGLARIVWHELGGTPTFREEDASYTGRVEVQAPWEKEERTPTNGWVANYKVFRPEPTVVEVEGPVPVDGGVVVGTVEEVFEDGTARVDLDATPPNMGDLFGVRMSQEEARAIARGEMPESFMRRVYAQRPVGELLDEIDAALGAGDAPLNVLGAAKLSAAELRRRLVSEG